MKISKLIKILILSLLISIIFSTAIVSAAYVETPWAYEIEKDNTIKIIDYTGNDTKVKIPWTIAGMDVKYIDGEAFSSFPGLMEIEIPDNDVNIVGELPSTITQSIYSITGYVRPRDCVISFDNQAASYFGIETITVKYDSAMASIAGDLPEKTGYTFGGYWSGENGTGTQYYDAEGLGTRNWDIYGDATLYAKWIEKPDSEPDDGYTIPEDKAGNQGAEGQKDYEKADISGLQFEQSEAPTEKADFNDDKLVDSSKIPAFEEDTVKSDDIFADAGESEPYNGEAENKKSKDKTSKKSGAADETGNTAATAKEKIESFIYNDDGSVNVGAAVSIPVVSFGCPIGAYLLIKKKKK